MRIIPNTRSNFLITESVGCFPFSADLMTFTVSAILLPRVAWFHPRFLRASEIMEEKSSLNSLEVFVIILLLFFLAENVVVGRLWAIFSPGATSFGASPILSTHLEHAETTVLPIGTCLTPTFIAPHNSQSAIVLANQRVKSASQEHWDGNKEEFIHHWHLVVLIAMSTDVESNASDVNKSSDEELKKLEEDYKDLHDEAQSLINERAHLESEIRSLKKRANRLDEEVRSLKNPPLIIGHLEDVLDFERGIVRSSNGTVFQVSLNQRLSPDVLKPGVRVALNQDTLAVIEVLHDAWDPMVSGAEMIDKPDVDYNSVAGLEEQVNSVREAIELPLTSPELFKKVGIQPPKGILLVGPPGCGKTLLAKAVANHTEATFIRMVGSELAQKYIGEGGRMVRELFSLAKEKSPSIIFLDEIDAIGAKRLDGSTSGDREVQRTLMQLLAELDGFDALEDVKIIAATNRPDILDDALLRPGRFDRIIEIPIPDDVGRKAIIELHISKMSTKRIQITKIVEKTSGYSGAELKAICVEAGMIAIREKRSSISQNDFMESIKRINLKKSRGGLKESPEALYS